MSYDRPYIHLTWGGTSGGATGDIWQCGVKLMRDPLPVGGGEGDPPPMLSVGDLSELWVSVIAPWMSSANARISSGAQLRWVKAATCDSDGHYTGPPAYITPAATAGGSQLGGAASPQDAIVYTLWSGGTLGVANHGRIYTPWSNAPVDVATGTMSSDTVGSILGQAVALIGGIRTWVQSLPQHDGTEIGIMHKGTPGAAATSKIVQYVKVGAVKDVQRRRRSALSEAYQSATIV